MARAKQGEDARLLLQPPSPEHASEELQSPRRVALPSGIDMRLSVENLEELRTAIERSLREAEMLESSEIVVDDQLRTSLRVACAKARLQRVRAEHVVIDLKRLWSTFPSAPTRRRSERLNQIVTACIAEYYAIGTTDDFAGG